MFNPFKKHNEEHDDLFDLVTELTFVMYTLQEQVKELREEVDFLVDMLDD